MKKLIFALFVVTFFVKCTPETDLITLTVDPVFTYTVSDLNPTSVDVESRVYTNGTIMLDLGLSSLPSSTINRIRTIEIDTETSTLLPTTWNVNFSNSDEIIIDALIRGGIGTIVNGDSIVIINDVLTGGIDSKNPDPFQYRSQKEIKGGGIRLNTNQYIPINFKETVFTVR